MTDLRDKALDRIITEVHARLGLHATEGEVLASVMREPLAPEYEEYLLQIGLEQTTRQVIEEMVEAGSLVDNGDGTYTYSAPKAV